MKQYLLGVCLVDDGTPPPSPGCAARHPATTGTRRRRDRPRVPGARADDGALFRRLERDADAAVAYDAAIALAGNNTERAFLRRRRESLTPPEETP